MQHVTKSLLSTTFLALLAASQNPVQANETLPSSGILGVPFQLESRTEVDFLNSTDDGPSGQLWRSSLRIPLYFPLAEGTYFLGAVSGTYSDYESAPFTKGGLETWDWSALAAINLNVSNRFDVLVGGMGSFGFEEGSSGDNFTGGGFLAGKIKWTPTFSTSIGALYLTRLEDDSMAVPFVNFDWQITDKLSFVLRGLETRLEYSVSDQWKIYGRGEFDPSGARLKDRKDTDATSFSDRAVRLGLGLQWQPLKSLTLGVDAGVTSHQLSVYEEGGYQATEGSTDVSPYVGLSITGRF